MKSITRLVTAVVAVIFAVATLCPAQDVKPTDLGRGAAFNGKKVGSKRHSRYLPQCAFSGSWGGFGDLADLGLGIAVMTIVRSFSKVIWRES